MKRARLYLLFAVTGGSVLAALACNGSSSGPATVPGFVSLNGTVEDWRNGVPLPGAVVRTLEIFPPISTTADANGNFSLTVPIDGYVILDVTSANTAFPSNPSPHVETYSPSILVGEQPLTVVAQVVSVADATAFTAPGPGGFGVTSTAGRGVILGRVLNPVNTPIPGVNQFQVLPVSFRASGPYFLSNTDGVPSPLLAATS